MDQFKNGTVVFDDNVWDIIKQFFMYDKETYIHISKQKLEKKLHDAICFYKTSEQLVLCNSISGCFSCSDSHQHDVYSKFSSYIKKCKRVGIYLYDDISFVTRKSVHMNHTGIIKITHVYTLKNKKDNNNIICSLSVDINRQ